MSSSLARFIRNKRKEKGYNSINSFAMELGKSSTYVWRIEKGKDIPSSKLLDKIASILGDRDYIYSLAGKIRPDIKYLVINDPQIKRCLQLMVDLNVCEKEELYNFLNDMKNKE